MATTNTPTPKNTPTPTPKSTSTAKTTTASAATTKKTTKAAPKGPDIPGISQDVIYEMSTEINNMLGFAVYNGITVNTEVNALIQDSTVDDLINAHNLLCENVAPATPKSIEFTKKMHQEGSGKSIFNKIPLTRNLMILAILFLAMFVATSYSSDVNNDSLDKGILSNHGKSLLLNLGYLASVAGLGVIFFLLKDVTTSIKKGTLVPEDTISYAAQILLGVIAGLFMSEILSVYIKNPDDINLFNKSLLALIGGFSSDAIFSLLKGLINRLKNIFVPANQQQS
ncbi:hypothetical protein AAON49_09395 [Pseudotenacibaculum sp. MALMAid0570]|uniref:hypothetical protein n=1 Tax=Pseudotenacibaculum sp. MALMAid0570 TaxID=3143938 RepID=UPI0032DFA125